MKKFALIATVCVAAAVKLNGQIIVASDSASDGAYQPPFNNWQNGDNGGTGFGAWSGLTDQFINASDTNGDGSNSEGSAPGVDIDTPSQAPLVATGASWGLAGDGGTPGEAFRGLPALQVGQTLRLDFDNGFLMSGQSAGFGLRSGGTDRFEFFFAAGGPNSYTVSGSANQATTHGFTDDGMRTYFTLTGTDTYSFSVDFLDDGAGIDQTFMGTLKGIAGSSIDTLRLFDFSSTSNANGNASGNAFYNSLEISEVPESSTWVAAGLGVAACVWLRLRRRVKATVRA